MRVLYISQTTDKGGATIALVNIISAIIEQVEVAVLLPSREGWLYDVLSSRQCRLFFSDFEMTVYPIACFKRYGYYNPISYLKFFKGIYNKLSKKYKTKKVLTAIIREYRPDIVHCNCGPLDISLDVCKEYGVPHVWHLREYQDTDFLYVMPTKLHYRKRLLSQGNYCIAITNNIFNYFNLRKGIDRVVYDGVFDETICKNIFIDHPKDDYFLYVGRIEPAKGIIDIIIGFSKFHICYSNIKLIIAGGYSDLQYYEQCKSLVEENNLELHVDFLGIRDDVYTLMQHARALIVGSPNEGFGFTTVEAMLNSCLVIGRNTAGTKEQFDKGFSMTGFEIGLRFENQDELTEKMKEAMSCDNYEMRKRAYEVVKASYTIQKHAVNLKAYYKEILEHQGN